MYILYWYQCFLFFSYFFLLVPCSVRKRFQGDCVPKGWAYQVPTWQPKQGQDYGYRNVPASCEGVGRVRSHLVLVSFFLSFFNRYETIRMKRKMACVFFFLYFFFAGLRPTLWSAKRISALWQERCKSQGGVLRPRKTSRTDWLTSTRRWQRKAESCQGFFLLYALMIKKKKSTFAFFFL